LLGGAITVITGLIASHWGPVAEGLFLAFPAIFPSGDADRKARSRKQAPRPNTAHDRGGLAAALDTRASAMGTIALAAFGLLVWKLLPRHGDYGVVIAIA